VALVLRRHRSASPGVRPGTAGTAQLYPGKADSWDQLGRGAPALAPVFPAELGHTARQLGAFRLCRVGRFQLAALRHDQLVEHRALKLFDLLDHRQPKPWAAPLQPLHSMNRVCVYTNMAKDMRYLAVRISTSSPRRDSVSGLLRASGIYS
jgi:hypothetical protein